MVTKTLADCSNVIVTGQNYVQGKIFFNVQRLILCFLCFLGLVGDKGYKESTQIKKFNLCFLSPCFLLFSQKSSHTPLLLNLNQIRAAKKMVFGAFKEYMGVKKVAPPIQGFSVNLSSVVELIVREQRLHQLSSHALRLMMKLDGRPFWGKIM